MFEDYYVMWLSRVKGINDKKLDRLIEYFGTAKNVFEADKISLISVIDDDTANNIYESSKDGSFDEYVSDLRRTGSDYVSKYNDLFPIGIKNIDDKPIGIYYKGALPKETELLISMVGSRRCTEYGKAVSLKVSEELAKMGITIVSGLADGIDSYSAIGALKGKGRTIGVLGTSIDKCYPSANYGLYKEIIEKNGCIISEYAPYQKTYKHDFINRNRIISALSIILIVVEAENKSGTFSTVDAALSYGKTIFAVPGSIFSSYSSGTNRLIRDGCFPLTGYEDILFELGIEEIEQEDKINKNLIENISENGKIILEYMRNEPVDMETLTAKTGLPVGILQSELTIMEVKGIIQRLPGQRYIFVM